MPDLELNPSRWLQGLLGLLHTVALVSLFTSEITWLLRLVLASLVIISLGYYGFLYCRKGGLGGIEKIWGDPDNGWYLVENGWEQGPYRLARSTVAGEYFVALHLVPLCSRWSLGKAVFIPRDALPPDQFRRLRVYLLWHGHQSDSDLS